ncbi:hypothetical protein ALP14_200118 [Pseudomonas amygdali pv. myricae]|nr:hypothetical protein ALP18_200379 [Pseudomonas amygdali pv. myricae]RMV23843.1 hypothetical protein ALP14_200118 [Pseudomonas amygdali pv. myricae]
MYEKPYRIAKAAGNHSHDVFRRNFRGFRRTPPARGRMGGRPKGLTPRAEATAMVAETLYRERKLSVAAIAQKLHVSKSTLYSYLRHRGVAISAYV